MTMLMTLSHCVVVKVCGSADGVLAAGVCESADGVFASGTSTGGALTASSARRAASSALLSCSFAMMASASANLFFCSSRACRFFSATALPAATRFGFFTLVTGTFEVTY